VVSSNRVDIGFGSKGNFSFAWGNRWSFFASFLASSCLASSSLREGGSGQLLVFHHLRSYVISRGDGGMEDFDTREKLIIRPKVISNGESSDQSPGAALIPVEHGEGGESTWCLWDYRNCGAIVVLF